MIYQNEKPTAVDMERVCGTAGKAIAGIPIVVKLANTRPPQDPESFTGARTFSRQASP